MLDIERLNRILAILQAQGAAMVRPLAQQLHVSPSTIRRDLTHLEQDGLIRRAHGGAMLVNEQHREIPLLVRSQENTTEKNMIGKLAARLVRDDMHLLLDGTSTTAHMTKYLGKKNRLKIITNSAQLALDCLEKLPAQICCTGGWLNPITRDFTGEAARQRIADFTCDLLFFSARSISLTRGITDVSEEDIGIKRQMLKSCRKAIFLCDHSKLDQVSFCTLCALEDLDCFITDKKPPALWIDALSNAGVRVFYPTEEGTEQKKEKQDE